MKIKEKGHTLILRRNEDTIADFIGNISNQYSNFKNFNLIIDFTREVDPISKEDVLLFKTLSEKHLKENRSFVLAVAEIDFNEFDEDLVVVPSILEAQDIIEMDEIQRDLGF